MSATINSTNAIEGLSDVDLMAIALNLSKEECNKWLNEAGSLRELLTSSKATLAMIELVTRFIHERGQRGEFLRDPQLAKSYFAAKLKGNTSEVFAAVFLDNHSRVIEYKELFYGTINGASVYPREVVKAALAHNAAAVIFAHNHPSGIAEPSQSDEQITKKLIKSLQLIDVNVLDHFVVGDRIVSFAERGLL